MTLRSLLLLSICSALLGSCQTATAPNSHPMTIKDLFPLAYGNYWTYKATQFNSYDTLGSSYSFTEEVIDTMIVGGHKDFVIDATGPFTMYSFYYDGDILYYQYPTSAVQEILQYPITPLDTIVMSDTVESAAYERKYSLTCSDKFQEISVPAGTFSCLDFRSVARDDYPNVADTVSVQDQYYSPGVGLVKTVSYDLYRRENIKNIYFTTELVSYIVR